jgi:hypothetical protein
VCEAVDEVMAGDLAIFKLCLRCRRVCDQRHWHIGCEEVVATDLATCKLREAVGGCGYDLGPCKLWLRL